MKLCLKWHNLSLLYIWSTVQEQLIKKPQRLACSLTIPCLRENSKFYVSMDISFSVVRQSHSVVRHQQLVVSEVEITETRLGHKEE